MTGNSPPNVSFSVYGLYFVPYSRNCLDSLECWYFLALLFISSSSKWHIMTLSAHSVMLFAFTGIRSTMKTLQSNVPSDTDRQLLSKRPITAIHALIARRFMGPTWDPSGADRTQVGPMLTPWTLLSGWFVNSPYLRRIIPCGKISAV